MSVIVTGTAGLCVWIVLWSLGMSGLDAIMLAVVLVLVTIAVQNVMPYISSRRDR